MYEITEWNRFLIPYEQAVEELKVKLKSIRNGYREVGEYSPIEFITGRVKKVSSILAKAQLRGVAFENLEHEIEDIAGIRIMCQLTDDIYDVVKLLRAREDLTIVWEKDYIENVKESGYRSYHVVARYPVNTAFGYKEVLTEFQIRTLAMNFWATIEHSLNYKYAHSVPETVKVRLERAAKAVWELDCEMQEISDEIKQSQIAFEVNSNIVREITDRLSLLKASGKLVEAQMLTDKFNRILDFSSNDELTHLLEEIKTLD